MNMHSLDLNLLQTLDVLLVEQNVTRAAQRLNLSQPSVSAQLARLRVLFDDPLLLPGPRGMLPTPAPRPCANRCVWRWKRWSARWHRRQRSIRRARSSPGVLPPPITCHRH